MSTTVDLQFLARQGQALLDETRQVRKEVADVRTLTLQTFEFTRRAERRQGEMRDDLELTTKMEFGGGLADLQTMLDGSLHRIEDKIDAVSDRVDQLEARQSPS